MNIIAILISYIIFFILCFFLPKYFQSAIHPMEDLSSTNKAKSYYWHDVLRFITIGVPIITALILWVNFVSLTFSARIGMITVILVFIVAAIIVNKKSKH